jgi:hypothetical protein
MQYTANKWRGAEEDAVNIAKELPTTGGTGRRYRAAGAPERYAIHMTTNYDVFISYSHHDRAVAARLREQLYTHGWSVWWDPDLRAGQHFDRIIEDAIGHSSFVIVLWSPASVESDWVRAEATHALHEGKLISTRIVSGVRLPLRFVNVHTVLLSELTESDMQLERMLGRPGRGNLLVSPQPPVERAGQEHRPAVGSASVDEANPPQYTVPLCESVAEAAADVLRSVRQEVESRAYGKSGIIGLGDPSSLEVIAYRRLKSKDQIRDIVVLLLKEVVSNQAGEAGRIAALAVLGLIGEQFPAELSYQTEDGRRRNLEFLRSLKPAGGIDFEQALAVIRQVDYDRWV